MCPDFLRGEIPPVPVDTPDPDPVAHGPTASNLLNCVKHGDQLCRRSGGGGRKDGRGAMTGMDTVGNAYRFGRPIHVVAARTAMRVNVHKSGADVAFVRVND